jgi:hypothetical protein
VSDLINHSSYPGSPTSSQIVSHLFEAPTNIGDNYGQRMHGWIKAPVSGEYTFWIASDDEGHLYLSTDENPIMRYLLPRCQDGPTQGNGQNLHSNNQQLYFFRKGNSIT